MKLVTILGTRPNFIKAYLITQELKRKNVKEVLIHTGQHYDYKMSEVFFKDLGIPKPEFHFNLKGNQTNKMVSQIRKTISKVKPDMVLLYGDTNSTLAGAIAAFLENKPIAHVEAGVRSFNMEMIEERNRILIDHYSSQLFAPTEISKKNLKSEKLKNAYFTGDVLYDSVLHNKKAIEKREIYRLFNLTKSEYYLVTMHRQETVDLKSNLLDMLDIFKDLKQVIFPIHPRTKQNLVDLDLIEKFQKKFILIDPLSYLDMLSLVHDSKLVLTDSGGIQKEAYFLKKPCIALMEFPVVPELVEIGWNKTVGLEKTKIIKALDEFSRSTERKYSKDLYGSGNAHKRIVDYILSYGSKK